MAMTYKTPGVYIEEIPKLPPSVAQVETAIPAFIGYTEKAEKNGENIKSKPTRISSFVEFEAYFGGPYNFRPGDIEIKLNEANNFSVIAVTHNKVFYMYDAIRLFFDNGGGDCYIVSVNSYKNASFTNGQISDATDFKTGVGLLEKYDEPTIILFPDAVILEESQFYPLQQAAMMQCGKLQDRIALLDLKENIAGGWEAAKENFRDKIGINHLKYTAAYTPWIISSYSRTVDFMLLNYRSNDGTRGAVSDSGGNILQLTNLTSDSKLNQLVVSAAAANDDLININTHINNLNGSFRTLTDKYNKLRNGVLMASDANVESRFIELLDYVREISSTFPKWRVGADKFKNDDLVKVLDSAAKDSMGGLRKFIKDLIALEKNAEVTTLRGTDAHNYEPEYEDMPLADANAWLGVGDIDDILPFPINGTFGPVSTPAEKKVAARAALPFLDSIFNGLDAFIAQILAAATTYKTITQNTLYAGHPVITGIVNAVKKEMAKIPPSGAIAGVYARVDNARGVWKAPANESLNSVIGPAEQITADQQQNLNVDAVAGKSINVIRSFTGKGTLVWGARTLAGNDNEWRYVSVRRFFNMVEESSKKATEAFVFEPNDANTWVKVQGMLENFLTILWRQGALQGAKPEHAFYVAVGLGKTMTALDVLEGRMIVEIGMAVVRPAEFIILRFSHKMAES
jgi:phage tail sheath protein FI